MSKIKDGIQNLILSKTNSLNFAQILECKIVRIQDDSIIDVQPVIPETTTEDLTKNMIIDIVVNTNVIGGKLWVGDKVWIGFVEGREKYPVLISSL